VHVDAGALVKGTDADQPEAVLSRLAELLLHGEMTPATRETLTKRVLPGQGSGGTVDAAKLTALILGSPEFQRR